MHATKNDIDKVKLVSTAKLGQCQVYNNC